MQLSQCYMMSIFLFAWAWPFKVEVEVSQAHGILIIFCFNYCFLSLLNQWYCHSNQGRGCGHNCSILVYHHCSQCPCMLPYFQGYSSSYSYQSALIIFFHSDLCVQRTTHSCKLFLFHFNGVIILLPHYISLLVTVLPVIGGLAIIASRLKNSFMQSLFGLSCLLLSLVL